MKQQVYLRAIVLFCLLSAFCVPVPEKITVYLIGDSTVCTQPVSQAPVTGWGTPFAVFFDETVSVENHARGGRSTRTFISEGRWQPISDRLQPGDYVFMQFGHNDEAKEAVYRERYTSPAHYRQNLVKFITETREKKAIPVLVTPVSRLQFDTQGKVKETHIAYSAMVAEIAKTYQVSMIDLDKRSRTLYQSFGPTDAKLLFNDTEPGVNPQFPAGIHDNTHFSEYGARKIAELVLDEMRQLKLELMERVVKP